MSSDERFKKATSLLNEGKHELAKKIYVKLLESNPANLSLFQQVIQKYNQLENQENLLSFYSSVLKLNPSVEEFWANYIEVIIKNKKYDLLNDVFIAAKEKEFKSQEFEDLALKVKKILKILSYFDHDPDSDVIKSFKELHEKENYKQLLEMASRMEKSHPKSAAVKFFKGAASFSLNDINAARSLFISAIEFNPAYAQAHYNLGLVYQKTEAINEAIKSYENAIKINPNYLLPYINLGVCLQSLGNAQNAIEYVEKALLIDPQSPLVLNNLGSLYQDIGDMETAINYYQRAILLDPNYADCYSNIALCSHLQGLEDDAKKYYQIALSLDPESETARYMVAALSGREVTSAPKEYIEKLFDGYATVFEKSLMGSLDYSPTDFVRCTNIDTKNKNYTRVLDLGCGTGLIGKEVYSDQIILDGVDISKKMLEKANTKKIYNRLFHNDIEEHLSKTRLDYDLYIAADVFIYIGDLDPVFKIFSERGNSSGTLAFSVEHLCEGSFKLQKSGRYRHSKEYITSLCFNYGFEILKFTKSHLRKENGKSINGGFYRIKL